MTVKVDNQGIRALADDYVVLFESPSPEDIFCYSPGICELASGRLVAVIDLGGPGVARLKAAMGTAGGSEKESRHYASMIVSGNDLLILSRSGKSSCQKRPRWQFDNFPYRKRVSFPGVLKPTGEKEAVE